jgi:hypothetical protein
MGLDENPQSGDIWNGTLAEHPMTKTLRITLTWLLVLLLLPLAGCFDYDVELTLEEDGSGELEIRLNLPQNVGGEGQQGRLANVVLPLPERVSQVKNGRLLLVESCAFNRLSELSVHRNRFDVKVIRKGTLGLTDYTYRVTATLSSPEGTMPDREIKPGRELEQRKSTAKPKAGVLGRAHRLRDRALRGRYASLILNLPGKVKKGVPVVVGDELVKPQLENGGATIRWRIPLSMLINQDVRHDLTFRTEFDGDFEFAGRKQLEVVSRYPTREDLRLAKDLAKKAGQKKKPAEKKAK